MSEFTLEYEVVDRTGVLTLENPPVNAMHHRGLEATVELLGSLPEGDERAVVFTTGGDRAFMAGHDANEFLEYDPSASSLFEDYRALARALYEFPLPLFAAVDGPAVGGGAIVASLCDCVVAVPDATFSIPEINVGLVGGLAPLRRVLPDGVARTMFFTGEPISAERAHDLGMVTDLDDEPVARATELAAAVASRGTEAVLAAKRLVVEEQPDRVLAAYHREEETSRELLARPATREAIRAFVEGRRPTFDDG